MRSRYEVLNSPKETQCGPFTAREDEIIPQEVFVVNKNILNDGKITKLDWQKIGKKLQRFPTALYDHWKFQLEPMLKRYHARTLYVDMKEVLISHLVENNLNYAQEVDWKELVKLPKFSGTTPSYLQKILANLIVHAAKKYPELSQAELTSGTVQRYLNNSTRYRSTKKMKYQENLIAFYVSNILKDVSD